MVPDLDPRPKLWIQFGARGPKLNPKPKFGFKFWGPGPKFRPKSPMGLEQAPIGPYGSLLAPIGPLRRGHLPLRSTLGQESGSQRHRMGAASDV